MIIIDFIFAKIKFYKNHYVILLIYGVAYSILNISITFGSGEPVYDIMDWKSLKSYIFFFAAIIVGILFHFLGYVLMKKKILGDPYDEIPNSRTVAPEYAGTKIE